MADSKSLSTQEVADLLHISRSTVYDLIRRGEIGSYKIGRKLRFTEEDVNAYIGRARHERSTAPVEPVNTGSSFFPSQESRPDLIISGQDVLLDVMANYLHHEGISAGRSYLPGFEGLLALYQGKVDAAACHLFDGQDYNIGFVRCLVPGTPAVLINLSYRKQGFYVPKGNPKGIKGWEDLGRKDVRIVNRACGSSARILLDTKLQHMSIPGSAVKGYDRILRSHLSAAEAVAEGSADMALGTERIAHRMDGIDFIPLIEERLDIVVKKSAFETPAVQTLLKLMNRQDFRRELEEFSGNDYRDLGKITAEL